MATGCRRGARHHCLAYRAILGWSPVLPDKRKCAWFGGARVASVSRTRLQSAASSSVYSPSYSLVG